MKCVVGLTLLAWLGSCTDDPIHPTITVEPPPWPGLVSDPTSSSPLAGGGLSIANASPVVYVSLAPGTILGGEEVTVRNRATASVVRATMVAGGLDPIAIMADAGDTLDIDVRRVPPAGGVAFIHVVAATRAPVVVRTDPPPRKRDVPLNAVIVIVFSEPIDSVTLTPASVQVLRGGQAVAGALEFRDPRYLSAAFVPAAALAANADYELIVTTAIRDSDGDALETPVTVPFTTGADTAPPLPLHLERIVIANYIGLPNTTQDQLMVSARDLQGRPAPPGVVVNWALGAGEGTIAPAQHTTAFGPLATEPYALASLRLGPSEGTTRITATAPALLGTPPAEFTVRVVSAVVTVMNEGFWNGGGTQDDWNGDVTVPVGKTVGWAWLDYPVGHDVVFEDDPTSPTSSPVHGFGGTHVRRFTLPGTYRYYCSFHFGGHGGTVTVTEGGQP